MTTGIVRDSKGRDVGHVDRIDATCLHIVDRVGAHSYFHGTEAQARDFLMAGTIPEGGVAYRAPAHASEDF